MQRSHKAADSCFNLSVTNLLIVSANAAAARRLANGRRHASSSPKQSERGQFSATFSPAALRPFKMSSKTFLSESYENLPVCQKILHFIMSFDPFFK